MVQPGTGDYQFEGVVRKRQSFCILIAPLVRLELVTRDARVQIGNCHVLEPVGLKYSLVRLAGTNGEDAHRSRNRLAAKQGVNDLRVEVEIRRRAIVH